MLLFITLFFFMLCTGLAAASNNQRWSSQPQRAVPYPSSTHVSAYPPTNTSQYPDPSAPPSYDGFANPPSYETATAPSYGACTNPPKTNTVW